METPRHIAMQRLLGGHLALDFVNTARGEGSDELFECLGSYEDLVAWGYHAGLLSEPFARRLLREAGHRRSRSKTTYKYAIEVRSTLAKIFGAIARGGRPSAADLETARAAYREAFTHGRLSRSDGGFAWTWTEANDLARMLWPVVSSAIELLTTGELDRVKACPGCGWLFLDATKNRRRRWCTMEDGCGAHEKMRRYVARRAARRAS